MSQPPIDDLPCGLNFIVQAIWWVVMLAVAAIVAIAAAIGVAGCIGISVLMLTIVLMVIIRRSRRLKK